MKPSSTSQRSDAPSLPARWEQELAELRPAVVRAVSRTCPPWLARQADDIVQNVMLQLLSTVRRGGGTTGFSRSYLARAAFGATMDEIRRHGRRREMTDGESAVAQAAAPVASPERAAASGETLAALRECLGRLVRSRRLAVTLYLQGCSVPETARRLRWTRKSAENFVFRGLANLRSCLQAKGVKP